MDSFLAFITQLLFLDEITAPKTMDPLQPLYLADLLFLIMAGADLIKAYFSNIVTKTLFIIAASAYLILPLSILLMLGFSTFYTPGEELTYFLIPYTGTFYFHLLHYWPIIAGYCGLKALFFVRKQLLS